MIYGPVYIRNIHIQIEQMLHGLCQNSWLYLSNLLFWLQMFSSFINPNMCSQGCWRNCCVNIYWKIKFKLICPISLLHICRLLHKQNENKTYLNLYCSNLYFALTLWYICLLNIVLLIATGNGGNIKWANAMHCNPISQPVLLYCFLIQCVVFNSSPKF